MIIKRSKLFSDKKDKAIGAGTIGVGGALLAKTRKGHLTGKVTRYHDTNTENVKNILKEGLKAKKANDPNNFTNLLLDDVAPDKKRDLIYTAKKRSGAFTVGTTRTGETILNPDLKIKDKLNILRGKAKSHKVLKLEFDYDKLKDSPRIVNPELRGAKNYKEFAHDTIKKRYKNMGYNDKMIEDELKKIPKSQIDKAAKGYKKSFNILNKDTHIFKGDISPSNIVGGKGYHKRTIGQVASYIKKNPKRFGKEAAKGLAGAALIGYGVHRLLRKNKEDDSKKK